MDGALIAALIGALESDYREAALERVDRAMLDYASKLTCTPGAMREADIAALREAGFEAPAIHDICAIVAYFAFVNRIADGLGVELEEGFGDAGRSDDTGTQVS